MASTVDVLTLDNYALKMPPWSSDLPNHLYALVDMGSNGIRFSISDLSPPRARLLTCVYRERAAISLFDALNTSSSSSGQLTFQPAIITQVSGTLARFKSIADGYGVPPEHISVFATEAMRRADNAAAMLDAIRAEAGLVVQVLAPEVETLFGSVGARSGFDRVAGLFLDLGGGSVQMTYVDPSLDNYAIAAAQSGKSLPFGAAKLIAILEESEAQVQVAAVNSLRQGMTDAFAKLQQEFPTLRQSFDGGELDIYLCGGGFRGYGSILMHCDTVQPYPISSISAYTVDGPLFKRSEDMRRINAEYPGKIFGMSKRRRRQFPAIATVIEALIHAVPRIRSVTFCSGGNREGALLLKLPESIKEANPLSLLPPDKGDESQSLASIARTVLSALPANIDFSAIPTVFTLGLGSVFASRIWVRLGESSEANAGFELHDALTRDPSAPGLTHLARSVLGLTLCFRWGASLPPVDQQLYVNLRKIVSRASPAALFWAEYIGKVASLLAVVYPVGLGTSHSVEHSIRLTSQAMEGKNKTKILLEVELDSIACSGVDLQELGKSFKKVGKHADDGQPTYAKVEVDVRTRE
ncbi:Ppx/GppA phosphatase family-domain-containing protein [Xylariomycetidae sp. FL0641]|nr:Ppx/GppA phosphatase family-domain-containing protein [Xylariomycetidae sp. FL0641]